MIPIIMFNFNKINITLIHQKKTLAGNTYFYLLI